MASGKRVYAPASLPSLHRPRQAGELADAVIRSDFRDTAFWTPAVVTNAQGQATVDVTWPDNLTQWRARAVGSTTTAQVGTGETRITTKKTCSCRLEAPRFLVERDIVTFSAIVHNDTEHEVRIRVKLDLDNADITGIDTAALTPGTAQAQTRVVAYSPIQNPKSKPQNPDQLRPFARENKRNVDHRPERRAAARGLARTPAARGIMHARMTAQSETDGDAAQTILPVLTHGVEREVVQTGVLRTPNVKTGAGGQHRKEEKNQSRRGNHYAARSAQERQFPAGRHAQPFAGGRDAGRPAVSRRLSVWLCRADHVALPAQRDRGEHAEKWGL